MQGLISSSMFNYGIQLPTDFIDSILFSGSMYQPFRGKLLNSKSQTGEHKCIIKRLEIGDNKLMFSINRKGNSRNFFINGTEAVFTINIHTVYLNFYMNQFTITLL